MPTSPPPLDLVLSQGSLQDFVDCPRRFQLRYVLGQPWPAEAAAPALQTERFLRQAERFHRLVHQHLLGVPADLLTRAASAEPVEAELVEAEPAEAPLARWWRHYLASEPAAAPPAARRYPEAVLSAALGDYLLMARYDLVLAYPDGRTAIFDWKTAQRRPRRAWLAQRLQTVVYPYVLVEAGEGLFGGRAPAPEQVEMVYWFAEFPLAPERFAYSAEQHAQNGRYLRSLVAEMERLAEAAEVWPLTDDAQRCRFCVYRSLCDRGRTAGRLEELEMAAEEADELEIALDFEQVAEIAY
ncbi:MAG: PD-(D/E)XK nuclease family protein [Caldilineales bacterium]|nr:PD-(D/E)XK nuclease family protein [Caldilineales bacterium]MDW8317184.1 PD-(D/E)XK nuclease family protein [Anaerolineae bacterium]